MGEQAAPRQATRQRRLDAARRSGWSRRHLLRAGAWTAGATLLAACGGGNNQPTATAIPATATTAAPASPTAPPVTRTPTQATPAPAPQTATASAPAPTTPPTSTAAPTQTPAPTATEGEPESNGGSVIDARQNDADSLDPQRTINGASYDVFRNIFDGLLTVNPALEFEPVVAERWEIAPDGGAYTFQIRQGRAFHDGSALTAGDVKYTFDRASNPDAPARAAAFINAYDHAELLDPNTIRLVLKQPNAPFATNIATEYFGILPQAAVEKAGDDFGKQPVGSGPWKFKEWLDGEQITLESFDDYQNPRSFVVNKAAPLADELIFRAIADEAALLDAFRTGEVNVLAVLPTQSYPEFKDDPDYQVFIDPGSTTIGFIEFATLAPTGAAGEPSAPRYKPPFDDLKLRQAVAYGIDADAIVETVYLGLAQRDYGPMPTGLFAYDPAIEQFGYHYDPDKAGSLLDEAGWAVGADGVRAQGDQRLELTFWCATDATTQRAMQAIQGQLAQIGLKLNIAALEIGALIAQLPAGDYNLDYLEVGWPEPDILTILSSLSWGMGRYRPADYLDLLTQARRATDQGERSQFYMQAQRHILADLPLIPLWCPLSAHAARKEVKDFKLGAYGSFIWDDVYIET